MSKDTTARDYLIGQVLNGLIIGMMEKHGQLAEDVMDNCIDVAEKTAGKILLRQGRGEARDLE